MMTIKQKPTFSFLEFKSILTFIYNVFLKYVLIKKY